MRVTELINLEQVAKQLDLDIETIRRAVRTGDLRACKFGNRYKTKQQWIDEYVEKQEVQVKQ